MGSVYLLGDTKQEGIYKIGVTRGDINKRIKKLQTGNSSEIYLVSYYETEHPFLMEKMLHNKYINDNVLNEWFALKDEDVINLSSGRSIKIINPFAFNKSILVFLLIIPPPVEITLL